MAINYEDERFTEIEEAKTGALTENEAMYDGMIDKTDGFYQAQIDASKEYADKQTQLQQQQTDFTIEQIQQQKDQAHKDYLKEQSAAYTDYQKQSNEYSVGAEQRAANGLSNTGYSESSQVAMYNAYQNRVATARDSYNRAVLNYDNGIKEAQLQNSAKLAEIAYASLQQQLELSLQGFQYKNQLILEKATKKLQIDEMYYSRFQDTVSQINQENALAEQVRQFNEQLAEEKRQFDATMAYNKGKSSGSSSGSSSKSNSGNNGNNSGKKLVPSKPKTYDDAVKFLKDNGASTEVIKGLIPQKHWEEGKWAYRRNGKGASTFADYENYSDYLNAYVTYFNSKKE